MLLEALVSQFTQRFQHEKRAQVCMWFDEREEFKPLLPALRKTLDENAVPPFYLLEYDAEQHHGQVWLKHTIHRTLHAAGTEGRERLRFVLYVPRSEDEPLELLEEYRMAGVIWRIGGKRPTLFSFLRQAGVPLPEGPGEQRRLYEGGRQSLLTKYVGRFADRPVDFWQTLLTADVAQNRLIGDVDQKLLNLAADPEGVWKELADRSLDQEFLALVRERFGFDASMESPSNWVREFVTVLALTETYLSYHAPDDFPLLDRLPPLTLRPHSVQLLHRWLRDSEHRASWDRWIDEVEVRVDLTNWAQNREGLSFGLPHLVRFRWRRIWAAFEQAAAKTSSTVAFCKKHAAVVQREAEFAKASHRPAGDWELLRSLDSFLKACDEARGKLEATTDVSALARIYVDNALTIEHQHVQIRYKAEERGLEAAIRVADRAYAGYAAMLNGRAFEKFAQSGNASVPGIAPVTAHLEQALWTATGRRAVIIVDALRYDCAVAIGTLLREQQVEVEPMMAPLPTVTPIGMTAILPLSKADVKFQIKSNALHPMLNGTDAAVSANRRAFLTAYGADCRDIADIENASAALPDLGELLAVFGHEEVDHIGHGDAQTLIRHIQLEIERLARLVRKLHRWGYPEVHVVTDHGFLLVDEASLPEEVHCEKAWCHVYKERFALVPANADVPLTTFPFAWDKSIRVAVPGGLAFFKAEKSFSHGGATLQEMIVPHLVSRAQGTQTRPVGVEVVLPSYELLRSAVKVVLRPVSAGVGSQLALFAASGRSLTLNVFRVVGGKRESVLADDAKQVRLVPDSGEQGITLFFRSSATFRKDELLELDIRDSETAEQFPPGGIKLTVGRDM